MINNKYYTYSMPTRSDITRDKLIGIETYIRDHVMSWEESDAVGSLTAAEITNAGTLLYLANKLLTYIFAWKKELEAYDFDPVKIMVLNEGVGFMWRTKGIDLCAIPREMTGKYGQEALIHVSFHAKSKELSEVAVC